MKREDKELKEFLAKFGINPDADAKKEKQVRVNPDTFPYPVGTVVKEVGSGCIVKIIKIDAEKGIVMQLLNRNNEVITDYQKFFESRVKDGYLEILEN